MAKSLKIIFLGGADEIGKNMTALEFGDSIIIVDAGMSFPTDETPGIDFIIPDFSYLKSNAEKVRGIFLTHGHEDHVGAVPFLMKEFDVPVYGAAMTLAVVANKLDERGIDKENLRIIEYGEIASVKHFDVEFLKVCHSIAGAAALSVATPVGTVFFTGDFKIDTAPIDGKVTDLKRMAEIGAGGVRVMLCDSTNAGEKGYSESEQSVGDTLDRIFSKYLLKRIVITTFSSHNYRIQRILDLAQKYSRKVVLSGRSMRKFVDTAIKLGEITAADGLFVDQGEIKKYHPSQLVIISAGSQGEAQSALTRMSLGEYSKVKLGADDLIVLSASPIPGNEKLINNLINNFYRLGAEVINDAMEEVHSTGHAHQEEIKLLISILKPEFFVPVHGEYRHMFQNRDLAAECGIDKENSVIPEIGMVLAIDKKGLRRLDNVPAGEMYVDGNLIEANGDLVLRDRKSLSESGVVIVLLVMSADGVLSSPPDVITRGFSAGESFLDEARGVVETAVKGIDFSEATDFFDVKAVVKKALKKHIAARYKQFPLILPLIIED